ncbi:hypothetical protein N9K98_10940 [Luminiphilus sp.]|nr:hypothetical protein [Luminiphilus sp.]
MTEITTPVEASGFYAGQNRRVAISVKIIVIALVLWASLAPDAGAILMEIQSVTINYFGGWYIYASAISTTMMRFSVDVVSTTMPPNAVWIRPSRMICHQLSKSVGRLLEIVM